MTTDRLTLEQFQEASPDERKAALMSAVDQAVSQARTKGRIELAGELLQELSKPNATLDTVREHLATIVLDAFIEALSGK